MFGVVVILPFWLQCWQKHTPSVYCWYIACGVVYCSVVFCVSGICLLLCNQSKSPGNRCCCFFYPTETSSAHTDMFLGQFTLSMETVCLHSHQCFDFLCSCSASKLFFMFNLNTPNTSVHCSSVGMEEIIIEDCSDKSTTNCLWFMTATTVLSSLLD